jgi:hypothetical protein
MMRVAMFAILVLLGCDDDVVGAGPIDEAVDGGVDAGGCPPYVPDAGVVRIRRGCPLTIDYAIR